MEELSNRRPWRNPELRDQRQDEAHVRCGCSPDLVPVVGANGRAVWKRQHEHGCAHGDG